MTEKMLPLVCATLASMFFVSNASADFTTIDFELGAPDIFAETIALTSEYGSNGVVFAGPAPLNGGGVLNQNGGFGIDARSGTDFLAFNRTATYSDGGVPEDPQDLLFSSNVRDASIYVGSGDGTTFLMEGLVESGLS